MPRDDDQSLGGEQTFSGKVERGDPPQSLGDQGTYAGGPGVRDTQSLGDQSTFGDAGGDDEPFDDGIEVVDLSARYTIEGVLGKGGMGEVLLAMDTRLERKVAIKRMLSDGAHSRIAVSRFISEAKAIAKLDHDNIIDVFDYGRSSDGPFLVMQYVDGGSLLDRCRKGALPVEEAVDLTCQICDALTKCHDAGVIHRDIKPANILMTGDGSPRLTDFGLVKEETIDGGQTAAGAVLGTLDFMPPEQRKDAALVDARSDLWALGATLYQMVSGRSPKIIKFSQVPQALHDVLEKALEDEKDDRYQTAGEFKDALRATTRTASQPIQAPAAELGAGECPKCHTRNESSRKFCSECAAALRVSCLKCETEIPIWDKVCGDCGGKQSELAVSKLEEFARQRDQAEEYRREYRFEDALQIARSLAAVEDGRIAEQVPWAKEFVTATEAEWERAQNSAREHFEEARKHRDAFDYASAIHAVESVPEAMRTSEVSGYLQQLERDRAESEELIKTISERVKRRDLKGLLEQVERAVELRGDRADLQKLAGQLREREDKRRQQRDEACAEAKRLLDTGDAKGALAMIQSVPSEDLRPSDEQLRSELEKIVAAEDKLTALVKESKADGVLDPDEVVSMWQATVSYLKLNPRHEKIAELQQQLEARIQKAPGKYAEFAELADLCPKQPASVLGQLTSERPPSEVATAGAENAALLADLKKHEATQDVATRLTLDVAQRFLADPESTYLFDYETIDREAAEALAKHKDYLSLSGLTSLSVEVAEALAKHTDTLSLSGLTSLSVEVAEALAKHKDYLSLDGLTSLSVEVAEALAKHTDTLSLEGLTSLSVEVAEALAKHKDYLSLEGLTSLSVEVAEALAKHTDSIHLDGLTSLSVEVAEALAKHKGMLSLSGLTSLSVEVAEALAKHKDMLSLEGLTSLSVEAARALAKHQGTLTCDDAIERLPSDVVSILKDGATRLTLDVAQRFLADPESTYLFDYETIDRDAAEALAKHKDSLSLSGLTSLSVEVAEALAKHKDMLSLEGLTSLSVEVAEALAKHKGSLSLDGLTSLSVEVAEALAKHKDSLFLDGLTSLSVEVAEALAKHKDMLSLDGLTSLSVEVAEALTKHKVMLFLDGLTSLSVKAARVLAKHQGGLCCDDAIARLPSDVASILKDT